MTCEQHTKDALWYHCVWCLLLTPTYYLLHALAQYPLMYLGFPGEREAGNKPKKSGPNLSFPHVVHPHILFSKDTLVPSNPSTFPKSV